MSDEESKDVEHCNGITIGYIQTSYFYLTKIITYIRKQTYNMYYKCNFWLLNRSFDTWLAQREEQDTQYFHPTLTIKIIEGHKLIVSNVSLLQYFMQVGSLMVWSLIHMSLRFTWFTHVCCLLFIFLTFKRSTQLLLVQ